MTIVLSEDQFIKYIGEGLWTGTNHNIKDYPTNTTVSVTTPDGAPNANKVATDMRCQWWALTGWRNGLWGGK